MATKTTRGKQPAAKKATAQKGLQKQSISKKKDSTQSKSTPSRPTTPTHHERYTASLAQAGEIPYFNLNKLHMKDGYLESCNEFWAGLESSGAVWLKGHPFDPERLTKLLDWTRDLHSAKRIETLRSADPDTHFFRGYDPPYLPSSRGSVGSTVGQRENRHLYMSGYRDDLEHPNIWPSVAQWPRANRFKAWYHAFHQELYFDVIMPLLRALAVAANHRLDGDGTWDDEILRTWHDQRGVQFSFLKYPIGDRSQTEMPEHTDDSTLTFMVSTREGLEIQDRETRQRAPLPMFEDDGYEGFALIRKYDRYIRIPDYKGSDKILIIAGDFLEKWTKGAIKATRHRVRTVLRNNLESDTRTTVAVHVGPKRGLDIPSSRGWKRKSDEIDPYPATTTDEFVDAKKEVTALEPPPEDPPVPKTVHQLVAPGAGSSTQHRGHKAFARDHVKSTAVGPIQQSSPVKETDARSQDGKYEAEEDDYDNDDEEQKEEEDDNDEDDDDEEGKDWEEKESEDEQSDKKEDENDHRNRRAFPKSRQLPRARDGKPIEAKRRIVGKSTKMVAEKEERKREEREGLGVQRKSNRVKNRTDKADQVARGSR